MFWIAAAFDLNWNQEILFKWIFCRKSWTFLWWHHHPYIQSMEIYPFQLPGIILYLVNIMMIWVHQVEKKDEWGAEIRHWPSLSFPQALIPFPLFNYNQFIVLNYTSACRGFTDERVFGCYFQIIATYFVAACVFAKFQRLSSRELGFACIGLRRNSAVCLFAPQ